MPRPASAGNTCRAAWCWRRRSSGGGGRPYFLSQLEPGSLGPDRQARRQRMARRRQPRPARPKTWKRRCKRFAACGRPPSSSIRPDVKEDYLSVLRGTGVLVVSLDQPGQHRFPSRLIINPLLGPGRESYEFTPRHAGAAGRRVTPSCGRRFAGSGRSGRRSRCSPSAPWSPWATTIRTIRPASWPSCLLNCPEGRPSGRGGSAVSPRPGEPASPGGSLPGPAGNRAASRAKCRPHRALSLRRHRRQRLVAGAGLRRRAAVDDRAIGDALADGAATGGRRVRPPVSAGTRTSRPTTFARPSQDLLGDPLERQAMARCGRKLIDGRGPDRLVTALEVLLHPSRQIQAPSP